MKNECREYAKMIAEEIEKIYNGKSEEENRDGEIMTLYDYIAESLDYEYIMSNNKTLRGVRIYVTLGGPTCWIDTEEHCIKCHWGADCVSYYLAHCICDEIEEIIAEWLEVDL